MAAKLAEGEFARAYGEWVIVRADPRVKQTAGGIHLPDQTVQAELRMEGTGTVLSIGHLVPLDSGEFDQLDRVCFRGFLKDAHKIGKSSDGSDVFIIHYKDLLAVVDGEVSLGAFS